MLYCSRARALGKSRLTSLCGMGNCALEAVKGVYAAFWALYYYDGWLVLIGFVFSIV